MNFKLIILTNIIICFIIKRKLGLCGSKPIDKISTNNNLKQIMDKYNNLLKNLNNDENVNNCKDLIETKKKLLELKNKEKLNLIYIKEDNIIKISWLENNVSDVSNCNKFFDEFTDNKDFYLETDNSDINLSLCLKKDSFFNKTFKKN